MQKLTKLGKQKPQALKEGHDYYIEDGKWVFTEKYHLQRGYCCQSGCRHCPYKESKKSSCD